MSDPLLRYYEQELTLVRRALGQFGQQHSGHAERLKIHQGQIEDPSLARLLDGVALLNASVEKKLSDQLPEVIEGLLGVLYPSYIQTIPSVAYLELGEDADLSESTLLPKGSQFNATAQGKDCVFTTVDDLQTTPFAILDTYASNAPFKFNRPRGTELTTGVIQIKLSTQDPDTHFSSLDCDNLDLFVQGFENNADSLVELLLAETQAISVSDVTCEHHVVLDTANLSSRVSDEEFRFLPQKGNQFSGYQLVSEFFCFKEKRQFFRIKEFKKALAKFDHSEIVLNLFMHSLPTEFIRLFDRHVFKLNIVPAINLFDKTGEPTNYDQRSLSVPVNADAHSDDDIEIVEVKEVFEITSMGEKPLVPLFKDSYRSNKRADYWQCTRDSNSEFRLAISLNNQQELEFNRLYGTRLLCTNGKIACSVQGSFECLESINLPGEFYAIYPPSAPIAREPDPHLHWQFVALLNANFSSLLHSKQPAEALKQILRLCSRSQIPADEIQTIRDVKLRSQVSALRILGKNVFCPGTEIEITLDTQSGFLAFSDVLNRFFQQYCSFDRYIQLSIRVYGRDGFVKRYPKYHGSQYAL